MKSPKILIVEDELIIGMDIKNNLQGLGYDVLKVVSSGEEAVKEAGKLKPDIILMDIILSGKINGIDAVKQIKEKQEIPVIYLTAHTQKITFERARETNPYGYLVKPIGRNDIYTAIETALHRHELESRLKESEKKYRHMLQNFYDGYYELDLRGNSTFLNDSIYRIYGYPKGSLIGKSYKLLLDEKNARTVYEAFNEVYRTGKPKKEFHWKAIRKDGTTISVSSSISLILDEKGGIIGFRGAARDVSEIRQKEEALRESKEKYHSLYTSMNEGLSIHEIIYDDSGRPVDYRIIDVNPKYESILGIDRGKAINAMASELYGAGEPPYLDVYSRVAETGEPVSFETYFPPIDKHFTVSAFSPGKGRFVTVFQDITKQKHAEEGQRKTLATLRESEDRLRTIFDFIPTSLLIIDAETHTIIDANPTAIEIIGTSRESVIGSICHDFICPAAKGKCPISDLGQKIDKSERVLLKANGERLPIMKSVISKIIDGRECLLESFIDIGPLKEAEEGQRKALATLRESEEIFRSLSESSPVGIFHTDNEGRVLYTNNQWQEITGLTLEESLGFGWSNALHPDDKKSILQEWDRCLTEEKGYSGEFRFVSTSGDVKWVYTKTAPIRSGTGQVTGHVGSNEDITERKQSEKRIEHLNAVLNAIRNVNHITTQERVPDRLLKGICDNFVITRGYYNAWIALLDESGKLTASAESGLGEDFNLITEKIKNGELTRCGQHSLLKPDVIVIDDPKSTCTDCPLSTSYGGRGGMTVRLEYKERIYGILSVSIPLDFIYDSEEQYLFKEVARDISLALYNLKQEEKRIKAEESQRKAVATLRESEEKYRNILENIEEGYFEVDLAGNYTFFNDAFCRIYRYPGDELLGSSYKRHMDDSTAREVYKTYNKIYRTKQPAKEIEREMIRKDGSRNVIETSASLITDSAGKGVGFRGVIRDITEHKLAEEAMRESEERFRNLADMLPESVFEIDKQFNLTYVNQAGLKTFGYTQEDLDKELNALDMLVPDSMQKALKRIEEILSGKKSYANEYTCIKKDGTPFPALIHIDTINKDESVVGFRGVIVNITDRKQAEEQTKASLREKEILLKEIHHRVKNNMQVITSLLSLQENQIEDEKLQSIFRNSENRIRSMALVHERLYQSENLSEIDFDEYIRIMATELYQTYLCNPERIELEIKAQKAHLGIDRAIPCGLILNELITNAIKYAFPPESKRKGKIKISMKEKDNTIELAVKDNGVGISKDIDIDNTDSLGLSLVSSLAKSQLMGELDIDRNKGTAFTVRFQKEE